MHLAFMNICCLLSFSLDETDFRSKRQAVLDCKQFHPYQLLELVIGESLYVRDTLMACLQLFFCDSPTLVAMGGHHARGRYARCATNASLSLILWTMIPTQQ